MNRVSLQADRVRSIAGEIVDKFKKNMRSTEHILSKNEKIMQRLEADSVYLKRRLFQFNVIGLKRLAREIGLPVANRFTKEDTVSYLLRNFSQTYLDFTRSHDIISIDIGLRNMAIVCFEGYHVKSISLPEYRISTTETAKCAEYAIVLNSIVEMYRTNSIVVVEQQTQRLSIKCCILEAQLHAFFFPRARTISSRSVTSYLGLQAVPKSRNLDTFNDSSIAKTSFKKKLSVEITSQLFHDFLKCDDSVLAFIQKSDRRDSIADAVLNGIVFKARQRKLIAKVLELFED